MQDRSGLTFSLKHRAWRRTLQAGCFLACLGSTFVFVQAQTVTPVIDENVVKAAGKKAKGKIEYVNTSLQPLAVTLETQSFTVSDTGEMLYRPLDAGIHVK